LKRIREKIDEVERAQSLSEISKLKKLSGHAAYYRIRVGDYRLGITAAEDTVVFVRFLNRKDIYKYFP
jgi:mRNA interferase RelE/StbE